MKYKLTKNKTMKHKVLTIEDMKSWLDVQARALQQAGAMILESAKE